MTRGLRRLLMRDIRRSFNRAFDRHRKLKAEYGGRQVTVAETPANKSDNPTAVASASNAPSVSPDVNLSTSEGAMGMIAATLIAPILPVVLTANIGSKSITVLEKELDQTMKTQKNELNEVSDRVSELEAKVAALASKVNDLVVGQSNQTQELKELKEKVKDLESQQKRARRSEKENKAEIRQLWEKMEEIRKSRGRGLLNIQIGGDSFHSFHFNSHI